LSHIDNYPVQGITESRGATLGVAQLRQLVGNFPLPKEEGAGPRGTDWFT